MISCTLRNYFVFVFVLRNCFVLTIVTTTPSHFSLPICFESTKMFTPLSADVILGEVRELQGIGQVKKKK